MWRYKKRVSSIVCEGCHAVKLFPLRCKGKFCLTRSVGESQKWAEVVANDMFSVTHRHVIFTIEEGLQDIFLMEKYWSKLLKGLMDEAARILFPFYKKRQLLLSVVAVLHTFGSKLEFNPHIHMVVTMGGITKDGRWEDYDYLPFGYMNESQLPFITTILSMTWHQIWVLIKVFHLVIVIWNVQR